MILFQYYFSYGGVSGLGIHFHFGRKTIICIIIVRKKSNEQVRKGENTKQEAEPEIHGSGLPNPETHRGHRREFGQRECRTAAEAM